MRQAMIQNYNMNSVGVQPADFVTIMMSRGSTYRVHTRVADEMAIIAENTTRARWQLKAYAQAGREAVCVIPRRIDASF